MQLFNHHKIINEKEADALLEKYYEGFSSAEEEKCLQIFLSQPGLPERYNADRALLDYFATEKAVAKKYPKSYIFPVIRWASVAAVLVGAVFLVKSLMMEHPRCYAYVDGKKTTDVAVIKSKALESIETVRPNVDEVAQTVKQFNAKEMVKEQLSVFAGKQ